MYIPQSELFKDLSPGTMEAITIQGKEKTFGRDELLFSEGDKAECFYVLGEGSIHLSMMGRDALCFVVNRPGEVFGWSSLVAPYKYRANARCTDQCRLLQIPCNAIEKVTQTHPEDGITIFRNLAGILTGKLGQVYRQLISDAEFEEMQSAPTAKVFGG